MPENTNPHFLEWSRYLQSLADSLGFRLSTRKACRLAPFVMLYCADDGARPPHGDPTGEQAVRNVLLEYMGAPA